ncbi:hypothetical protein ACFSTI_20715 [Rhizorhabdus histidinilytica]|nr:hypothetical protein [Rhizorhabdus histidinilytica]
MNDSYAQRLSNDLSAIRREQRQQIDQLKRIADALEKLVELKAQSASRT